MRKNRTSLSILLTVFLSSLAIAAETNPPSSATIYQTLEQFWSNHQYRQLAAYIDTLERSYSDYVPVQIARAIYSHKYGAQVEDAIDRLRALRSRLQRDIAAASPVFMDMLDSRIRRYEKMKQFYVQQGISPEQRLVDRDPLKTTDFKHSEHWGDEMLFFNAPEVLLSEHGVAPVHPEEAAKPDPKLHQKDAQELMQSVGDNKTTMPLRRAAAKALAEKRASTGGLKELARGLDEANMVYTYRDTVEELAKVGRDAVPVALEALNDPASSNTDKKCAIWALVRIGVADPGVIQNLQAISTNADRADLAKYAQDALQYLQAKVR